MNEQKKNPYLIPSAIIIAGVLIAGAIFYTKKSSPQPAIVIDNPDQAKIEDINIINQPYLGNPEAKVKIVYYGDFQCPFCQRFETTALPSLKEKYLKTGRAVLYFKNFQFLGPDSITAGIAGECLINQLNGNFGPYWQWHEAMIVNQDTENSGWGSGFDIKNLVRELKLEQKGIDLEQFETCLDNKETLAEVQQDTKEGRDNGVTGTPATFINGQLISGAQPLEVFETAIELEL